MPQTSHFILVHCKIDKSEKSEHIIDEGIALLDSYGAKVVNQFCWYIKKINSAFFIGSGAMEELKQSIEFHKPNGIFWNDILSYRHIRNLEKELKILVYDRTTVILDIFMQRASSSEEKLQLELAKLQYARTRLVGAWDHLERQRGTTSTVGGPGEKQIELDRRMLDDKIQIHKNKLKQVHKTRQTQRKRDLPMIALVGYTNSGKTTLFNLMTESDKAAENKLFCTLTPYIRKCVLPSELEVLISDTVGFISKFPTLLLNAFYATLKEIQYADLILHVRDINMPNENEKAKNVMQILEKIQANHIPIINVWSKWDLQTQNIAEHDENNIYLSSNTKFGYNVLLQSIDNHMKSNKKLYTIEISINDTKSKAWLYQNGTVESETQSNDVLYLNVWLDKKFYFKFHNLKNVKIAENE